LNAARRSGCLAGLAALVLGGCATIPREQRVESDPWESANRPIHAFNTAVDNATLKPIAKGYRAVAPSPVRKGISNFFDNLRTPASAINNFLQAKPGPGFSEIGRFVVNSTVGIGGLIDIAGASGFDDYTEDFGQTAAVWGVPDGPFVMLPFMGPSTLRDAVFMPVDVFATPLYHYDNTSVRDKLYVLRLIDLRYRLLSIEELLADSKDPYVTIRESYLQNREYEVYDGNPPEDDDFYDDFMDEE